MIKIPGGFAKGYCGLKPVKEYWLESTRGFMKEAWKGDPITELNRMCDEWERKY